MPVETAPLPRKVLVGDRVVTLRRLVPADVDGLEALYRSLPGQDRYQRFFTEGFPPRRTLERYVAVLDRPGWGVVAVAGDGSIVGEAGYARLAGGDGEFGITVAAEWRGLGTALLDTIVTEAARAGVPSLQADVVADNRAMLALAAKRGYALIHIPDHTVVRITLGTQTPVPPWPAGTPSPRLLVETPGWQWRAASEAEAAGFHVVSCRGPSSFGTDRCPALQGQDCPLVGQCDAVVVSLPADDPSRGALVPAHRGRHPRIPVFLQAPAGEPPPAWLPDGVTVLPAHATPDEMVSALTTALAGAQPR